MPYVLIFIAILGISYEYRPDKDAPKILNIENFFVISWLAIFLMPNLVYFFLRIDANDYQYSIKDYCLMGYVIVPFIITLIEIIRAAKEYFNDGSNNDNKGVLAVGGSTNV